MIEGVLHAALRGAIVGAILGMVLYVLLRLFLYLTRSRSTPGDRDSAGDQSPDQPLSQ